MRGPGCRRVAREAPGSDPSLVVPRGEADLGVVVLVLEQEGRHQRDVELSALARLFAREDLNLVVALVRRRVDGEDDLLLRLLLLHEGQEGGLEQMPNKTI